MSKDKTFEELWAEAVKKIPSYDWDDPKKSDDERRAEYEKRFDRIILPPPYPDDPKRESTNGFRVPLSCRSEAIPAGEWGLCRKGPSCRTRRDSDEYENAGTTSAGGNGTRHRALA